MNTPIHNTKKINIKAILSVFSVGMFIKTDLEKLGLSATDLAEKTKISLIQIEDILNDKMIVVQMNDRVYENTHTKYLPTLKEIL